MPGLIDQGQQPVQAQPQMQPQAQAPQQGQQAPPENQDQYNILVPAAMRIMHGKSRDDIIKHLEAGDPTQMVAEETVKIVNRLEHEAAQAGNPIKPEVLFGAIKELIDNMVQLGVAAGAIEDMDDTQKVEVGKHAVGLYMQNAQQSGKINQQGMQALAGGA